jgi:hypothetical protein
MGIVDYNPLVPALGAGRRPTTGGRPALVSINQFTNYGQSWYHGVAVTLANA